MLETDDFLIALRALLIDSDDIPELNEANVVAWHHGEGDPNEDIANAVAKGGGVSVLIYDLGGDEDGPDSDVLNAEAAIELFVATAKRNRKKDAELRLGGQIRDSIMRLVHRNSDLRNMTAVFDARIRGYVPLDDPDFTAWRITVARAIYL